MRTIQQQLQKWLKANKVMHRADKNKKEPKTKRLKERLTERELKELMGVNRPIYRRAKGGAFRQR
jgi:phage antirepressor YoqD-like protein